MENWSNYIGNVDLYRKRRYKSTIMIKFDHFRYKFRIGFEFGPKTRRFGPRFRIGFVATINPAAGIESKIRLKSDSNPIKVDLTIRFDLIALAY